ncbi:tetratricopeptide repeat protein [Streptomyces sp. UC4497]
MTALEELANEFGDAVASAIIESLLDSGLELRSDSIRSLRRGYTGARLAKAVLADVNGPPKPRWCVIKLCPPVSVNRQREIRQHKAALKDATKKFRRRHLTGIAFPPVDCPRGFLVVGQSIADGIPLGAVNLDQLADACEVIWSEMLSKWTGDRYDSVQATVAELLRYELGSSFESDGWLRRWAQQRRLLTPVALQLPGEAQPLPNPWRMFDEDTAATRTKIDYLVGPSHGDLHGDNVLVPEHDGIVEPTEFRLIDLATYDARAPLSRDLAALMVSLCWREIGASSPDSQSTYLSYLERDRRDRRLEDGMAAKVRRVIDAFREPALQFVGKKSGNPEQWYQQLRVSLLAQAMLHSAYATGTADARRWCARLAGRLTQGLLGPVNTQEALPMSFDAGEVLGATRTLEIRTTGRSAPNTSDFVDRTGQRSRLRAALGDQVTSVIVVSGSAGIGKTALVREVLADLGWADLDDESSAVRWHDVTPYGELGVPTLIEDIEPSGSGQVAGRFARARLEIALDSIEHETEGDLRVIVLDSAENLLKDGHILRDSELDLALEAVQRRSRPLVKVIFVTQHVPAATSGVAWTETACRISLEGLEPPSLREYFAVLDPSAEYGLVDLPEDDLRRIHARLAGNPRLAELLHAVLSSDPPGLQVHEIVAWLSMLSAREVQQRLVRQFVDSLPAEQQRVAESLAVLGIPVGSEAVISILEPYVPAARIEPALRALVAARLVMERRDGCRYLRKSDIETVLSRLSDDDGRPMRESTPPSRSGLALRAARVLRGMQKDDEDIHGIADLDMHFARVDVWLRAGMHDQAHSLIDWMDDPVRVWGSGAELRTQREAVRGRLGEDRESEMMNLAALGDIYSYSGDFSHARTTYAAALTIAKGLQHREAIRRIHINMGYMFWEHDHVAEAEEHYGWALGLAGEDSDDGGDRAAALLGLADCRQRHGDYRAAVTNALSAFESAHDTAPKVACDAALRMTRWYAELNCVQDALTMLVRSEELIEVRPDPSARAEVFNSKADLYLHQGRYGEALTAVERAIGIARDHRDPVNLRRSLTTLALTHVHTGDLQAAREAIEESARYRVAGVEIVELALRGIIAHRFQRTGTARDLFRQLHHETGKRIGTDEHDLVAWDFTGIALCHSVLLGEEEAAAALMAFRRARPKSAEQTPGLDNRVRFMVTTLANGDPLLGPVLTELGRIRPGHTS